MGIFLLLGEDPVLLQWSEFAQNLVGTAGGLGVIGAIVYAIRYWWGRRRWMAFSRLIEEWAREDWLAIDVFYGNSEADFRSLVAHWMNEAQFSPKETAELFETAVIFGRSRVLFTIRPNEET